jgi:hypothetical protein
MDNEKVLLKKVAELSNINMMVLCLLVAVIALSVGLGFFFLVPGNVGYGIGIAMFIVAGLLFVIGELTYFTKMGKIKRQED